MAVLRTLHPRRPVTTPPQALDDVFLFGLPLAMWFGFATICAFATGYLALFAALDRGVLAVLTWLFGPPQRGTQP
jgi:hypothetical protein